MKQLYLLPLSLILMIQGFGNDPLFDERETEDFTGTVILAPDEASLDLKQVQKLLSVNAEKFNPDTAISYNEYDDYDDDDYGYDDDRYDLSLEYDDEQDQSFISIDAAPSPDEVPAVPKSQKIDPAPAKEGASYGIPDLPPPATPKSQKAVPAPAKEASTYGNPDDPAPAVPKSQRVTPAPAKEGSTYGKPVNPSPASPRGSSQQGPSQPERKMMPEEATAPRRTQQPQTARQAPAQRKQQAPRSSSQQEAASLNAQKSQPARQAPAQRKQQAQVPRSSPQQAAASQNAQKSQPARQAPAQRKQQAAAPKNTQKSQPERQAPAQRKQQAQSVQREQRSSASRQNNRAAESAQADDYEIQSPARTTPRQRAYQQSSPRNTREQGRLQAQSSGANMGTPYSQKINQNSGQPSGPTEKSPSKLPQAINMPARPVVKDGWNLWILGEALLWQAVQENMEYIYKGHDGSNNSRFRDLKKPEFDWDWGWRFGAGYNIPRDGWDLSLIWTHIENRANGTTHRGDESLDIVWSVAAYHVPSPTVAHAHWNVHLDQVDFDLGRQFYVGRYLTIHPKGGLRSTWIFQDYDVSWSDQTGTQKNDMKNKYWGFGFFAGLDSDWMLGWGFSLFGDAGLAILLGFFDIDQHGTFNGATNSKISDSFRTGRPIFDLDLGVKWAKKIYNDRFALAFKVGYEYHLYFNQNQFLLSNGNDGFELFNPINGDLTYQGVTFSGQFDF